MNNYRKTAHSTYDIKYHIVWITKYRKPVITGQVAERTRELIRIICKNNEVQILAGHVGKDHIHAKPAGLPQFGGLGTFGLQLYRELLQLI